MFDFLPSRYRYLVIVCLVAMVVATAYRHRNADWVQNLLRPEPPPKVIKFDNGSVRDQQAGAPVMKSGLPAQDTIPPGVMRKCVLDRQTIYSDQSCPDGFQVADIKNGNVTVVPRVSP
jgi:hypothetical protein